jgi:RimJ/RimL family protein N-acetyltransferase
MGILVGEREIWGQGLGLEAWETLMNYLLNEKKLRKVTAGTLNCNLGMLRIMERSGMVLEGVRTKQEIVAGEPQDMLYFAKFQHV